MVDFTDLSEGCGLSDEEEVVVAKVTLNLAPWYVGERCDLDTHLVFGNVLEQKQEWHGARTYAVFDR